MVHDRKRDAFTVNEQVSESNQILAEEMIKRERISSELSESKAELDRFIQAMIDIHKDIMEIADGKQEVEGSVLRHAPHTAEILLKDQWEMSYSREKAAFPLPWVRENKFWPSVSRINDGYGDRNLVCSCEPLESYRD